MGSLYPNHVLASHLNFVVAGAPSFWTSPLQALRHATGGYTAAEKAGLERTRWFRQRGSGYSQLHGTKPHTPGFSLVDSPVGLLAWIYEKLRDWTDAYPWTDDEVLTWVSIYLFSDAGADASLRIYYETMKAAYNLTSWNKTPLGLSYFPKDLILLPSSWGHTIGPVVFEKRHEKGGHFASIEEPELLVADLRQTVRNAKIPSQ